MNRVPHLWQILLLHFIIFFLAAACNQNDDNSSTNNQQKAEDEHDPKNALKGLKVAGGLSIAPYATRPMLKNPTNIDVDERGRVWVTEAFNYRPGINGNPTNPQGDRIVILEDSDGEGDADTSKV